MQSQIFILRDDQTLLASATSKETEDYRAYLNFAKCSFFFFFFCPNDNTESSEAPSRILISIFLILFKLIFELVMSCRCRAASRTWIFLLLNFRIPYDIVKRTFGKYFPRVIRTSYEITIER